MPRVLYKNYEGITSLARDLRRNQTPSEKIMWELLRKKRMSGYKFIRQHPVFYHVDRDWAEFYISDFYCAELGLIIEVDGEIHSERQEYDLERDSKLMDKGFRVIRFKNEELKNPDSLIIQITEIIENIRSQNADTKSHSAPSLIV